MKVGHIIDDRYEVLSILGQGGFSVVYKARQLSTGQLVAVKVLQSEPPRRRRGQDADKAQDVRQARFQREMQLISKLRHPNIVRLVDSGALAKGSLYMVLEFIEGEDLHTLLNTQGALKEREARHLMTQVLDALCCAHMHGVVHRDLKPQNIMITTMGYRRNATVLDFGISAVMENQRETNYMSLTRGTQIHGTPAYMAPEQLSGKNLTPQSDLYAWGLVFLEVLTGRRVMDGENPLDVALRQVNPEPIEIPTHATRDPTLRYVLERCLAKKLADRFVSTEEVIAVLEGEDVLESAAHDRLTSSSSSLPTSNRRAQPNPPPQSASALIEELENTSSPAQSSSRVLQGDLQESLQRASTQPKDPEIFDAETMDLSREHLASQMASMSQNDGFSSIPEEFSTSPSETLTADFDRPSPPHSNANADIHSTPTVNASAIPLVQPSDDGKEPPAKESSSGSRAFIALVVVGILTLVAVLVVLVVMNAS